VAGAGDAGFPAEGGFGADADMKVEGHGCGRGEFGLRRRRSEGGECRKPRCDFVGTRH